MFNEFYGLTGKPFQLTPDPEFYFRSVTHRKALSYLGYGLAQGEGFIVITGEIGSGKSTLVAHMMQTLDARQVTVAQIVTSKLDGEEIVHVVARSFGLDIDGHDKASALSAIEGFLHEEARAGRRCLLVIDEAQNLSVSALEELRMLSNFQLGNHPLLQVLLLGQPEFRSTLQSDPGLEQLRQRVIAAHHLEPMLRSEMEAYLTYRLERVGWNGNPAFDQRVFTEIFEASDGIPRKINQIANRLLLLGAVEQSSRIDAPMLQAVLAEMASERDVADAIEPRATATDAPNPALPDAPQFDPQLFDDLLAERDVQIAELQQAIVELASQQADTGQQGDARTRALEDEVAGLRDQLAGVEARAAEQERTIRQTLSMLIEFIEREMDSSKAA
jgi:putative secretion ATPase (PEP-CTERM system associated)